MRVTLSPAEEADFEFAFDTKCQALGPYVETRWGWDSTFQRELHRKRWVERPWSIIAFAGQKIGTVSIARMVGHIQFGEFYLLPQFQNQGLGTEVLRAVLQQADEENLSIKLEYLKGNPVGPLYIRHGFVVEAENENHYFLVRLPRTLNV